MIVLKTLMLGAAAVTAVAVAGTPRSFTWTGPDGRSGSAEVTRSVDPATGEVRHEGTITTLRGETWTGETVGRCGDGSCSREASFTGPRGDVVRRSAEWRRNADGSLTGIVTWEVPAALAPFVERRMREGAE